MPSPDERPRRRLPTQGAACTRAVIDQFAARWFPRPLHGVGRAMLCSFYGEPIRRVHPS